MHALLLALGYFAIGRLGLLLAIPPGYASPVWPAAGIALAAVLCWGRKVLPGVFLGSVAVNLWVASQQGPFTSTGVLIAVILGLGATAQAAAAAWAIRRLDLTKAVSGEADSRLAAFLALAGPVGCVTAATVGVTTLYSFGAISLDRCPVSWMNWWIGDTLGALIFTPVTLALSQARTQKDGRRALRTLVPLGCTFAFAIVYFLVANDSEEARLREQFELRAKLVAARLGPSPSPSELSIATKGVFGNGSEGLLVPPGEPYTPRERGDFVWRGRVASGAPPDLVVRQSRAASTTLVRWRETYVPISAFALAAALGALLLRVTGQQGRIERLVEERTRQLSETVARLAASERRSSGLLQAIPDLVLRIDQHGVVTDVSAPPGVHLLAGPHGSFVGMSLGAVLRLSGSRLRAELSRTFGPSGATSFELAVELPGPSGTTVHHFECRTARSGDDEATAIVCDVSKRKRYERLIAEQQAKLVHAAKMSTLGEMSAGVAHEINNPLTAIQAGAELLTRGNPAQVEDLVARIKRNTQRIASIVRGLRSFARDAQQDPLQRVRIDELFRDALELCRERIANHGISLTVHSDPELALDCQPTQMLQVLLNLLSNAHDAVVGQAQRRISLVAEATGDRVRITVADSGTGIDAGLQQKIYEPFFTTKEVGKGTGLGLSISKGIVEDHGGSLSHARRDGVTYFEVVLPQQANHAISITI